MNVVTTTEMIDFEKKSKLSHADLTEKVGKSIAAYLSKFFKKNSTLLFLIGPGNNGADGLYSLKYLKKINNYNIKIFLTTEKSYAHKLLDEFKSRDNIKILGIHQYSFQSTLTTIQKNLDHTYIIDAIFGSGLKRKIENPLKGLITELNKIEKSKITVLSIDIPSGINPDTGQMDVAVKANITLGIWLPKVGYFLGSAPKYIGKLEILDIGLNTKNRNQINYLLEYDLKKDLPERPLNSHKGTYGKILAIVGSREYIGAAYLVCMSAYRSGVGLVTLVISKNLQNLLSSKMIEPTYLLLPNFSTKNFASIATKIIIDKLPKYNTIIIGSGIGLKAKNFINNLLSSNINFPSLVLDADALNIISQKKEWWKHLPKNTIITPHLGEFSMLTKLSIKEIEFDKIRIARNFSIQTTTTIVLKGAYPIIATPDGEVSIAPFANPLLSTAGTGDVKAGIIGGLLAQGLSIKKAAIAGTYLHGQTAEKLKSKFGFTGLLASDLIDAIPFVMQQ